MADKTTVPLYYGDDQQRLRDLRRQVDIAEKNLERVEMEDVAPARRLGDDVPDKVEEAKAALEAARDAYDAFVDEAADRAEMWTLEPIGHAEFRALLKDHQPRKVPGEDGKEVVHPDDAVYDVNVDTFPMALLTFTDPEDDEIRTITAVTVGDEARYDTTAALRKRLKRLSAGEFETMWAAAYFLNRQGVSDPKSLRYSPTGQRSDAT